MQKEKARACLWQLSKLFTEPSDDPDQSRLHRYTLRGISATKNTTYICRQAEADLIDMEVDDDAPKPKRDQWWSVKYSGSTPNPVTVEKTTQEDVLEAAMKETKNLILVYASEAAMQWPINPLPPALEVFVREDNLAFKAELTTDGPDPVTSPKSPSKRKYQDSPDESADWVEWTGGSPKGGEDSVKVTETEVQGQDVIIGVDPTQLIDVETQFTRQEMQERNSLRVLSTRPNGSIQRPATIDSMDMDQIMEDTDTRDESAAVKHVGFVE